MSAALPEIDVTRLPDDLPGGLLVVDVREDDEWEAGHIEGALHIPLMQLPARIDDVARAAGAAGDAAGEEPWSGSANPTSEVLMVCRVGARSAQATAYLQANGVNAINLAGGMVAWHHAGRPMVSDSAGPPSVA